MSDSAISQDEIDALLSGVDTGTPAQTGGNDFSVLNSFSENCKLSIKTTLDMMTGNSFTVSQSSVYSTSQGQFLEKLPETVLAVTADFSSGIVGDHIFLMGEDFGKKLSGLLNHEENPDLDEMSLSVISEVVSQIVGTENTDLSALNKIPNLMNNPAQTQTVAKGMIRFPQGENFVVFEYKIALENSEYTLWELVSKPVADAMTDALTKTKPAAQTPPQNLGAAAPQAPGGVSMPNVQSVQYSTLQNNMQNGENGNIGLIMDVFMEMTVELGRTKKQVKEILSMGEGTIIELDKLAGEPVDILVNHKPIAKGEVVVIDENFGVRVTEILAPGDRVPSLT